MKCSLPAKAWSRYIQLWLALVLPTSLIKQLVGFPGFLDEETRVGERKQSLCLSKEPWRLEVEWTLPSLPCPIHPVTECWFCNHWWCQIFFLATPVGVSSGWKEIAHSSEVSSSSPFHAHDRLRLVLIMIQTQVLQRETYKLAWTLYFFKS